MLRATRSPSGRGYYYQHFLVSLALIVSLCSLYLTLVFCRQSDPEPKQSLKVERTPNVTSPRLLCHVGLTVPICPPPTVPQKSPRTCGVNPNLPVLV